MPVSISVIIPVYQAQAYLPFCLNSILAQTFSDFEVLCVNDGSRDDSAAILADYAARDARIRVITQENKGVSAARNAALRQARGDYITFLDSDDMWHPRYLERMITTLRETQADFVSCSYHTVPAKQEKPNTEPVSTAKAQMIDTPFDALVWRRYNLTVMVWGKMFRREILSDLYFDERISYGEDYIFVHQAAYIARSAVVVPDDLVCYRTSDNSLMRSSFSDAKVQAHFLLASVLYHFFKECPMQQKTQKRLFRQIAKLLLKYTMSYPLCQSTDNYRQYWHAYAEQLKEYHRRGIYCPRYLSFKNRLVSWLFLHRNFTLLRLIGGV